MSLGIRCESAARAIWFLLAARRLLAKASKVIIALAGFFIIFFCISVVACTIRRTKQTECMDEGCYVRQDTKMFALYATIGTTSGRGHPSNATNIFLVVRVPCKLSCAFVLDSSHSGAHSMKNLHATKYKIKEAWWGDGGFWLEHECFFCDNMEEILNSGKFDAVFDISPVASACRDLCSICVVTGDWGWSIQTATGRERNISYSGPEICANFGRLIADFDSMEEVCRFAGRGLDAILPDILSVRHPYMPPLPDKAEMWLVEWKTPSGKLYKWGRYCGAPGVNPENGAEEPSCRVVVLPDLPKPTPCKFTAKITAGGFGSANCKANGAVR